MSDSDTNHRGATGGRNLTRRRFLKRTGAASVAVLVGTQLKQAEAVPVMDDCAVNGDTLTVDFSDSWKERDEKYLKFRYGGNPFGRIDITDLAPFNNNVRVGLGIKASEFNPPNTVKHKGKTYTLQAVVKAPVDVAGANSPDQDSGAPSHEPAGQSTWWKIKHWYNRRNWSWNGTYRYTRQ